MKQWYESLFENYSRKYDQESFTQGTSGECDFLESELGYDRSLKILDLGCGTGRHTIELVQRGYAVTGVDLSEDQLSRAREKAAALGIDILFLRHDARELPFRREFDAVIMLCEGGFPLMETDGMNYLILQGAARALRPAGRLIFTTLNGLFPLHHSVEEFCSGNSDPGNAVYRNNTFDLMTFRDHNITEVEDDSGETRVLECSERYYVPSEISWLLDSLGFTEIDIFSARLGAFSREHRLGTEDFEMLVCARLPEITLRRARLEEREKIYRWLCCSDITSRMMGPPDFPENAVPTWEEFLTDFENFYFQETGLDRGQVMIAGRGEEEIGCVCSASFHLHPGCAELDVWMKDKSCTGRGWGPEALRRMMDHLKNTRGIHHFLIRPAEKNLAALHAYRAAGFRDVQEKEQTLRAHLLPEYHDLYLAGDYGFSGTALLVREL